MELDKRLMRWKWSLLGCWVLTGLIAWLLGIAWQSVAWRQAYEDDLQRTVTTTAWLVSYGGFTFPLEQDPRWIALQREIGVDLIPVYETSQKSSAAVAAEQDTAISETAGSSAEPPPISPDVQTATNLTRPRFTRDAEGKSQLTVWANLPVPTNKTVAVQASRVLPSQVPWSNAWQRTLAGFWMAGSIFLWIATTYPQRPIAVANQAASQWFDRLAVSLPKAEIPPSPVIEPVAGDLETKMNASIPLLSDTISRLQQENQRASRVLGNMVEGVLAVDQKMRVILVNPAGRQLLGIASGAVLGRSILELIRQPKVSNIITRTLNERVPLEGDFEVMGHSRHYLRLRALPLVFEDTPSGALITISDETRLRQLENLRREFVANVSHELKTPLAAIKAYSETLLIGALEDTDNNRHFVEKIAEQADRLDKLIADMLQLARVQSGIISLRQDSFPVVSIVQRCISDHESIATERNVNLQIENLPDDLLFIADREAFRTITTNLIGNAIRYTLPGGHVKISARKDANWSVLRVQDNGIGIPEEDQNRIFERFYRVEKARTQDSGGTGLGLAIVKNLSQAMGGQIYLKSRVGEGSTFELRLPNTL